MNVDYPGSEVGGNTETHPVIVATILGAMAPAAPDRVMASEGTTHGCLVFGGYDARNDEPFGALDISYVGYGGRSFADGNDATDSINGNCANTPVEVFETRFPWIVEEYGLCPDSGGAGAHRGGLGASKTMLCTGELMISQMTNKHKKSAWGLNGGADGLPGATLYLGRGRQPLDHGWRGIRQDLDHQVLERADPPRRARLGQGAGRWRLRRAPRARSRARSWRMCWKVTSAPRPQRGTTATIRSWIARYGKDAPLPEAAE